MSFHSWLQNLRSALAPRQGQRHHRRRGSPRAATLRPSLEVLEDRLTPSLAWAGSFPVPVYPQALVTGDFNNDGHLDLTAAISDGTVSVGLGDGHGGFGVALQSAVGTGPGNMSSMAVADLNNDGNLDVVVINQSSAVLSVLLGNGDGSFRPPVNTAILAEPQAVAAADFNADGHMDLVYTSGGVNGGWGSVEVLLGDGQGGFAARHQYQVHTQNPGGLAVADLNTDGRPDVVTVNPSTISVLLGNGDGTLRYDWSASNFTAGPDLGPTVAVGDFTGDGIPDLVTTSGSDWGTWYAQERANVLPGRGDGTFAAQIQSFAGYNSGPLYLAAADFDGDGDGKLDVFTVDLVSDSAVEALLLGEGNGTFTYPDQLGFGGGTAVVAGDFNGDGRPDVAVADLATNDFGIVSVALNDGNWDGTPPSQASRFTVSGFPSPTVAGQAGSFTVSALDSSGSVLTSYTGTVHFTSSDAQAGLPADYTFTAADQGAHTFSATLKTAGTQSLTVAESTATGTQAGITVNPAAASRFTVAGFPSPVTAGVAGSFTVTPRDPYGNRATGYTGTVHFTSGDAKAALPGNYTFTAADAGMHTFSATLKTAGTQSLTATDTVNPAITGAQGSIQVNPAAASRLVLSAPARISANAPFNLTVTVVDAYGNVVTGYRGTISFSSSDTTANLPKKYTFMAADQGVHTFTGLRLKKKGQQTITGTDTLNSPLTGSVLVDVL
jgi:hypothetical protein